MLHKVLFGYLLVFGLPSMVSCTSLQRSPESGYSAKPSYGSKLSKVQSTEVSTKGDVGNQSLSLKGKLKQMENSLSSKKELDQYSKTLPLLKDELERLEFLSLPSYEARQSWMAEKNITSRNQSIQATYGDIVDSQDIAIGMPQNLVRKSWGEPETVEVSGHPSFRNERWKYHKYVSTNEGYRPEKKIVYFEGGRVVGWETE